MHWGEGRILNYPPPDVNIDVKARALGDKMTVFFLTDHPDTSGDNLILIDVIALYPDESAPAVELPPTATPTPEPAPQKPKSCRGRPGEVQAAAPLPTDTPTATPTATSSPIPTDDADRNAVAHAYGHRYTRPHRHLDALALRHAGTAALGGKRPGAALTAARAVNVRSFLVLSFFGFAGALVFGGGWLLLRRKP